MIEIGSPKYVTHTSRFTEELKKDGFTLEFTFIHGVKIVRATNGLRIYEYIEHPEFSGHFSVDVVVHSKLCEARQEK